MTRIQSTLKTVASSELDEQIKKELESEDKSIASLLGETDGSTERNDRGSGDNDSGKSSGENVS